MDLPKDQQESFLNQYRAKQDDVYQDLNTYEKAQWDYVSGRKNYEPGNFYQTLWGDAGESTVGPPTTYEKAQSTKNRATGRFNTPIIDTVVRGAKNIGRSVFDAVKKATRGNDTAEMAAEFSPADSHELSGFDYFGFDENDMFLREGTGLGGNKNYFTRKPRDMRPKVDEFVGDNYDPNDFIVHDNQGQVVNFNNIREEASYWLNEREMIVNQIANEKGMNVEKVSRSSEMKKWDLIMDMHLRKKYNLDYDMNPYPQGNAAQYREGQ